MANAGHTISRTASVRRERKRTAAMFAESLVVIGIHRKAEIVKRKCAFPGRASLWPVCFFAFFVKREGLAMQKGICYTK